MAVRGPSNFIEAKLANEDTTMDFHKQIQTTVGANDGLSKSNRVYSVGEGTLASPAVPAK